MLFEEFVAARGPALLRFAYVLTLDAHAEDLVQSALTDAYRHWRRVSAAGNADAYVQRIVVNTHLGWRRRRSAGERPTGEDLDSVVVDARTAPTRRGPSLGLAEIGITLNLYSHVTPAMHESASSTLGLLLDRPGADHDQDGPGSERSIP